MVSDRISHLSSSKKIYKTEILANKQALEASGQNIKYQDKPNNRQNRLRKIIWFNPPYLKQLRLILVQNCWPWLTSILRSHLWGNTLIETLSRSHILASPTLDLSSLGWNRKVWLLITIFATSFSFSLPSFLGEKRKGEWCSKNRDQKSYLPVSSSLVTIEKLSVNIKYKIKYFHSENVTVKVVPNNVPYRLNVWRNQLYAKQRSNQTQMNQLT